MAINRYWRNFAFFYLFVAMPLMGQETGKKDSLEQWFSSFYQTRMEGQSPDGKWVAVKKVLNRKADTILVFNTGKAKQPVLKFPGASSVQFLDNDFLLTREKGQMVFRNLRTTMQKKYPDIKSSAVLENAKQFIVLDLQGNLEVFSRDGNRMGKLTHVKSYVTDHKEELYAVRQGSESDGIWKWDQYLMRKVYRPTHETEYLQLSDSSKFLLICEMESGGGLRRTVVMDTHTGGLHYPLGSAFTQQDFYTFKEVAGTDAVLIKLIRYADHGKNGPEVWYGNDRDLKSMQLGKTPLETNWIWNSRKPLGEKLGFDPQTTVSSIGSSRYFIYFKREELQDYTRNKPLLNVHLFDFNRLESRFLATVDGELYASAGGKFVVVRRTDGGWLLYSTETGESRNIAGASLRKPVFSMDSQSVYFESDDDLWCYSIRERRLSPLKVAAGKRTGIINSMRFPLATGYPFYTAVVDTAVPLLIDAVSRRSLSTVYLTVRDQKKVRTLVKTENYVPWFQYSKDLTSWSWLEENYNVAPQLKAGDFKGGMKTLSLGNELDTTSKTIRQQRVEYTLSDGKKLQGILYYPKNFDPARKYPMIVNLYQVQHHLSNHYLLAGYDVAGFNVRNHIERGYFVYLPDVITDQRGPGIAGLECVNRALDVLLPNKNIDFAKVGLTGHSFGSYLTNFIATRSHRFAAYLSGSGISDLISSYFSFNYNYYGPHYWQLETGQYQMGKAFAEDKELYIRNSPIWKAENVNAPILLWTGKKDENVIPEQTMEFYIALTRNRKNVIALFYPDSGHDLSTDGEDMKDLNWRVLEWWDYFLKDIKNVHWIERQMKKDAGKASSFVRACKELCHIP